MPEETPLTPELLIRAYCAGAFPMARERDGRGVDWYAPDPRAIFPLDGRFRVRRSLARVVRRAPFRITRDAVFEQVIRACAEPRLQNDDAWISNDIIDVFTQLHDMGLAHSLEAWQGDQLVGGVYGLSLRGAFFAESMFSHESYASQVCLVKLVDHLRQRGFSLLDVQFTNPHLEQFGVVEVTREDYLRQLGAALEAEVSWDPPQGTPC